MTLLFCGIPSCQRTLSLYCLLCAVIYVKPNRGHCEQPDERDRSKYIHGIYLARSYDEGNEYCHTDNAQHRKQCLRHSLDYSHASPSFTPKGVPSAKVKLLESPSKSQPSFIPITHRSPLSKVVSCMQ